MLDNPEFYTIDRLKETGMWPLTFLSAYGMIPYLKRMPGGLVGIEVGVLKGENAFVLLEELPNIKYLYGVDPYLPHSDYDTHRSKEDMDEYLNVANKNLSKFDDRYILNPSDSYTAARHFKKESMDFILLDGEHTYEGIVRDLGLYFPLLKKGGYIFVHDSHIEDVKNAVMDFRRDQKVRIPLQMSKNFLYFWQK